MVCYLKQSCRWHLWGPSQGSTFLSFSLTEETWNQCSSLKYLIKQRMGQLVLDLIQWGLRTRHPQNGGKWGYGLNFTASGHHYILSAVHREAHVGWKLPPGNPKGQTPQEVNPGDLITRAIQIQIQKDGGNGGTEVLFSLVATEASDITTICNLHVLIFVVYTLRARCCLTALFSSCTTKADGMAFRRLARVDPHRPNSVLCRWVDIAP